MRSANVIQVGRVSIPESGRSALQVLTDSPDKLSAFYIPVDGPTPELGTEVRWAHRHVSWIDAMGSQCVVPKIDFDFDPSAPLQ